MTIHFIGAGPGAADLITLRGLTHLKECDVCLYAGSLVPQELLSHLKPHAQVIDSASLTLDEIITELVKAHRADKKVVRLHSGDPSLYGALNEQLRALDDHAIPYDITPGVPSFAAAAASLKMELTLPDISQSVILTRIQGKASAVPESLSQLANKNASLILHLSIRHMHVIHKELAPLYGDDHPVIIVYHASRSDEKIIRTTLKEAAQDIKHAKITRTALIIISPLLTASNLTRSALYDDAHRHLFRPKKKSTMS